MKLRLIGISAFAVAGLALVLAKGQYENLRIDDAESAQTQQKLVRVCSLNSIQANQEFQRNVRVLQTQRQRAVEINTQIEASESVVEKAELSLELEAVMAKLNENNRKMVETYGFSLTRNYTVIVEEAHVYMFVSNEEAAQVEEKQKEQTGN